MHNSIKLSMAPNSKPEIYETEEEVAVALAKYVAYLSDKFIKEKGYFSVVLSGGTLIHTLRKLLEPPYNGSIDWSKWLIFWVDERVVSWTDEYSNYKLAMDGFISKLHPHIPPCNIYAINERMIHSPMAAAEDYQAQLKSAVNLKILPLSPITGFPKFDLELLGMGQDGHVASLFPNRPQRFDKKDWVTFITDSPKIPPRRITFTFPVINSASYIAMVVTGDDVADAVKSVWTGKNLPPLPGGEVSAEVELRWLLDKPAASKLVHN